MQLTVVFEHWHLGDGNYPPFAVGDEARLSFELDATTAGLAADAEPEGVRQLRDAEYEVVGRVIRQYPDGMSSTFPVIEAGWLRFFVPTRIAADLVVGTKVRFRGNFALDHYLWVEFLTRYPDPPDLFHGVRVTRIRRVSISERFIQRSPRAVAHPAALAPDEYTADDVRQVQAISEEGGPVFSLLDLEILAPGAGPQRPTFFGADA